nr:uncharacterized protein LOC117689452 [Crassostrea gigas]
MENISLNHNANTEEETKPKRVGNGWTIFKVNVMDLCCCCCCTSHPDPYYIEKKENYQRATRQEIRENEEIRPEDQNMENISLNHNANTEEETKPKRVGNGWTIFKVNVMDLCCCCCCTSPPDRYYIEKN